MKILFVCDTMDSGGAERVIANLSNEFSKMGHEVGIMMISKTAKEPFYILDKSIKLVYLTRDLKKEPCFFKKTKILRKRILGIKPDVVVAFLSYVCIYTWLALRKTDIPFIFSERNDPNHRKKIQQLLLNKAFNRANGCVFQTNDAKEWYGKNIRKKSAIIYNPLNLPTFSPSSGEKLRQILFVGRLTEQKNCLVLIDAFSVFNRENKDYILKIYGSGPLKNKMINRLKEHKLEKNVVFCGNSTKWLDLERKSSVFVLPSIYEGMPNVLAEALAIGIPSVSANCPIGGPKELKKIFGKRLILCEKTDSESLAKAMNQALDIPSQNKVIVPDVLKIEKISQEWIKFIKGRLNKQTYES